MEEEPRKDREKERRRGGEAVAAEGGEDNPYTAFILMDSLYDKLKLLNFDADYCAKKGFKPIPRYERGREGARVKRERGREGRKERAMKRREEKRTPIPSPIHPFSLPPLHPITPTPPHPYTPYTPTPAGTTSRCPTTPTSSSSAWAPSWRGC